MAAEWLLKSRVPLDDHQIKVTFPFFPHTCSSQHTLSKCKSTLLLYKVFFKLVQCYPEFNICLWQIFTTFWELCNWFVIHGLLKVWWVKEKSWLMGTGAYGYRSFEIWSFPDSLGPQLAWTKFMCLLGLKAPLWHQRAPQQNCVLYWPSEERHYWSKQKLGVLGLTLEAPLLKGSRKVQAILRCSEVFLQSFPTLELASSLIFILNVNYALTEEPEINGIFIFGFLWLFRALSSEWNHFLPASSEYGCRPQLDLKRETPLHSWLCAPVAFTPTSSWSAVPGILGNHVAIL